MLLRTLPRGGHGAFAAAGSTGEEVLALMFLLGLGGGAFPVKSRQLTAIRDELIHGVAQGKKTDLTVDDSKTLVLPPVPTNFKPSEKNGNPTEFLSGEAAIAKMKVHSTFTPAVRAASGLWPTILKR